MYCLCIYCFLVLMMYLMVAAFDSCKCQFKHILLYKPDTPWPVHPGDSYTLWAMRVPGPNERPTTACILSPKRSQTSRISSNQPSSNVDVTNGRRASCEIWRSFALTRIGQSKLQTFAHPIFFSCMVLVLASGRSQGNLLPADKISRDLTGAKGARLMEHDLVSKNRSNDSRPIQSSVTQVHGNYSQNQRQCAVPVPNARTPLGVEATKARSHPPCKDQCEFMEVVIVW